MFFFSFEPFHDAMIHDALGHLPHSGVTFVNLVRVVYLQPAGGNIPLPAIGRLCIVHIGLNALLPVFKALFHRYSRASAKQGFASESFVHNVFPRVGGCFLISMVGCSKLLDWAWAFAFSNRPLWFSSDCHSPRHALRCVQYGRAHY